MSFVETTLGQTPLEDLGRVNAHEHVIIDGGYTVVTTPDFALDNTDKAIEEVGRWKAAGGGAIVDTMPFGCGRNVRKLVHVSEATSIPIVVATGFQKSSYYLPDHWQHRFDEDTITRLILAECVEGVDENNYDTPVVTRSSVKAGFIKLAGEYNFVSATVRKLIRSAGVVHAETRIPILVHTEIGTACHELLDELESAGIDADRVMLCHVDRNPDASLHKSLAERGAFLEYDSACRIKYQPESVVVGLMREMFEAGHGEHLLLGGDMARRSYWKAYGGGPGMDYLLTTFWQRLEREGFSPSQLNQVWVENPARWLAAD